MKIQLFIDVLTNKVIGYNSIIPEFIDKDIIIIDDSDTINNLINRKTMAGLYYIDGKIIEKEEEDEKNRLSSYEKLENDYKIAYDEVQNENKIFMDNIINGLSIEEATSIIKNNRKKLDDLTLQKEELDANIKNDRKEKILNRFNTEEENIGFKYFLSSVAIVRDENEYLEEWITYHLNLGFEHFYIYDNESKIPVIDYLKNIQFKYLDKITVIDWKTSEWSQQDAYNNWLQNYKTESRWILTSDIDEFVVLNDSSKTLKEFLEENSEYSAIICLWKFFNANGQKKKSSAPVMERFTTSIEYEKEKNRGKVFVQTNRVSRYISHSPMMRLYTESMDYNSSVAKEYFQLNHYITKSYEEWIEKIKRGTVHPRHRRNYQMFFELNPDMGYLNTGDNYYQEYGSSNKTEENSAE